MKKIIVFMVTGLMVVSTGAISFADSFSTPAEIYAGAAGTSVEEAFNQRGEDQRFGELAKEKGVWDQFKESFLSTKVNAIEEKVNNGEMTSEEAEAIINQLEDCDGTDSTKLLSEKNMQFGKNADVGNLGNGFGNKTENGLRDGTGSATGQKNGNGRWND